MTAVSPITRQTVGRTFIVAITILGAGAVAQLAVIGWLFYARFHAAPVTDGVPGNPPGTVAVEKEFTEDPFDERAAPAPAPTTASPPKPTPVSQAAAARKSPEAANQERLTELIEQGRLLREKGELYAAVTRLREAQAMQEKNPLPVTELALTYEKMGFADRAAEAWRTVYDMGETAAGIYYTAAEGRLKLSQAQALRQLQERAPATGAPAAGVPPAAAGGEGEVVGLGPTSKLGLADLTQKEEADAAATRKFTLHVPVKAKPRSRLEVRDVIVQVLFYDFVNGRALEKTSAEVKYQWASPPADWSEGDVEQLNVTYTLPALRVADEERKYYGYIVSVYYKNALQDFRSDPPTLGRQVPPPRMLVPETPE